MANDNLHKFFPYLGDWELDQRNSLFLRPKRKTFREYPSHGTEKVMDGRLKWESSTDYVHSQCPNCGPSQELDMELLYHGIISYQDKRGRVPVSHYGLYCRKCGLLDRCKVAALSLDNPNYQFRDFRKAFKKEF